MSEDPGARDGHAQPPAGLTRTVVVPLRRLETWLDGFARRHPGTVCVRGPGGWLLQAEDRTTAFVEVPTWLVVEADDRVPGHSPETPRAILGALRTTPLVGVLLLRRAGYAVALLRGDQVVAQKVGTRHVHGRTAAGGWSQQRYARRRAHQADEIATAAGRHAQELIGPHAADLDVLVTGGDRNLLTAALTGPGGLLTIAEATRRPSLPTASIAVGAPTRQVLAAVPDRVLALSIRLEPAPLEEHR